MKPGVWVGEGGGGRGGGWGWGGGGGDSEVAYSVYKCGGFEFSMCLFMESILEVVIAYGKGSQLSIIYSKFTSPKSW